MAVTTEKIYYGLDKAGFAPLTDQDAGTYSAIVPMPGAVSLTLEQQGEVTKVYADNIVWYQTASNNGYEGDLELMTFPDEFLTQILGQENDTTNKILVERDSDQTKPFGFVFRVKNDINETCHVFYNCTATRPSVGGATKEESFEPSTQTVTISAVSLPQLGYIKSKTTQATEEEVKEAWFSNIVMPGTAPGV